MNLRPVLGWLLFAILALPGVEAVVADDPPYNLDEETAEETTDENAVAEETDVDESAQAAEEQAVEEDTDVDADEANADETAVAEDTNTDSMEEEDAADNVAEDTDTDAAAETDANAGLADLDKATQLKINAENLPDLNDVIDKIDSALEKGLDKENQKFADELLVSSLLQRATVLSAAVLDKPVADPRRDPRWMQVRQFAANDLMRIFELNSDIAEAHLLMGRLQALPAGDPKTAKREFTKVIDAPEATPEDRAQAHALRGTLQTEEPRRVADFDAAVKLVPYKPDYYRIRAQYRYSKDQFTEALADIDKALEMEPDQAMTQELRGLILLGLKRFDDARDAFQKASELAPEAVLPYQHMGEAYRQQGDLKKSAEQLTKALELQPNDAATLLLRANLYYQLKDPDAALKDVEAAIKAQPQLLVAHLLQAEILVSQERIDEAIANLEKLVPLAPEQTKLLEPLATFYLVDGQPGKSIETFTKVLELEPENYRALRFRGDANLNIGNHAAAVADFAEAYKLNAEDEGLLNNYAWVLATSPDDNVRDGKRAIKLATQAADMSTHSVPHILSTLAAAYAETGDYENAMKWSNKAIEAGEADVTSAQDSDTREKAEAALEALKKELASYEAGKPIRERQEQEEKESTPSSNDQTATPPVETKQPAEKLEL